MNYKYIKYMVFVRGGGGGGGGQVCAPHHANVCKFFATLRSYVLASFQQMTFKFGGILI